MSTKDFFERGERIIQDFINLRRALKTMQSRVDDVLLLDDEDIELFESPEDIEEAEPAPVAPRVVYIDRGAETEAEPPRRPSRSGSTARQDRPSPAGMPREGSREDDLISVKREKNGRNRNAHRNPRNDAQRAASDEADFYVADGIERDTDGVSAPRDGEPGAPPPLDPNARVRPSAMIDAADLSDAHARLLAAADSLASK